MVYLIAYELKSQGRLGCRPRADYDRLIAAIRQIPSSCLHLGESKWLLDTQLSVLQVRDLLIPLTYAGDELLVMRVENDWASASLSVEQFNWISSRNFSGTSPSVGSVLAALFVSAPAPVAPSALSPIMADMLGMKR